MGWQRKLSWEEVVRARAARQERWKWRCCWGAAWACAVWAAYVWVGEVKAG